MKSFPRLWHVLSLAIVLFGSTYFGVTLGWFRGLYLIDIPLHLIGGIIIGLFWWWLANKFSLNLGGVAPKIFSFVGFVTTVSFLWESYEFITWKYFASVTPIWELYSPTVSDLLSDLVTTAVGALLIGFVYVIVKRKESLKLVS